jgi:DNA (cytosine-5)-methyltransferase 1
MRHADRLRSAAANLDGVQSERHLAGDGHRGVAAAVAGHLALEVDWGEYATAVRRWEMLLGRDVPFPTQRGQRGRQVLSPAFVEHLMGLPAGWVIDLPLPRTAQLRVLGNGVVPQQAAYALTLLLADLAELLVADEAIRYGQEASAA